MASDYRASRDFACLTGDCPHDDANGCVQALQGEMETLESALAAALEERGALEAIVAAVEKDECSVTYCSLGAGGMVHAALALSPNDDTAQKSPSGGTGTWLTKKASTAAGS